MLHAIFNFCLTIIKTNNKIINNKIIIWHVPREFYNNTYVKSPGNVSLFLFGCLVAIIQSHYKKSINVLPRYTGLATSKDTSVIRHENELARKEKRGSYERKKEEENDVEAPSITPSAS